MGSGLSLVSLLVFSDLKLLVYADIHMIPRENLVIVSSAICIKCWVNTAMIKRLGQSAVIEFFMPRVES